MLQPGLAEMHLGIDDAGQHMQSGGVETLGRGGGGKVAQRRYLAPGHADIGVHNAAPDGHPTAMNNKIVRFVHVSVRTLPGHRPKGKGQLALDPEFGISWPP